MAALNEIEARIAAVSEINEVKAFGDYYYQITGGIEVSTDEWSDEPAGGWVVKNALRISINNQEVFYNVEEVIVNYSAEENKILVLAQREDYLNRMLQQLIALGY